QTTGQFYSRRFVMTYPNEQLPAGRPLKMAPAHDAMTEAGCRWGCSWGLETPLYFAPKDFVETPSLNRSDATPFVEAECRAVREAVGLLDITGFSRFEVYGLGAEAWLDRIFATKLPQPGRARLAVMLSPEGKLKGDLTLFNWGDGTWWIMGSYYLRQWHKRWFHDHEGPNMIIRDISDDVCGFSVAGPQAKALMQSIQSDLNLPFMGCGTFDIGLLRCKIGRLSVTGEHGYEIHCRASEHIALRRILLEAGAAHGLTEFGFNALLSLRIEKSYGIWSAEFTQDRTPGMTGMDRWIAWDKGEFVGRQAALNERDGNGPAQKLVALEVAANGADASGYEPVWSDGNLVGFITSGGYGHSLDRSLAMALVNREQTEVGSDLAVHVVGVERAAKVIAPSPYDPDGQAMRG
ncbi:MAG: glycine cleavage T C-terminal barrel domain-containing protein, partial [Pseudomonadota bacterium]